MEDAAGKNIVSALSTVGDSASALTSCSELWGNALLGLRPGERAELEAGSVTLDILDRVLCEAQAKQIHLEDKGLTFEFRGKKRKASELWGKIVGCISAFKALFGKVVALDVSGNSAIPWAVISLILGAIEYKQEQDAAVTDGLATVVATISYYAELERLYIDKELEVIRQLKLAVTEVYLHILRFLYRARLFYEKKLSRNILDKAKVVVFTPVNFTSDIDQIENGTKKVEMWANLVHRETERDIDGRLREMQRDFRTHEHREWLQSMSSATSLNDHVDYSRNRFKNTGLWLVDSHEFKEWRDSPTSSLMWLKGSIGTGKSILTSLVVDSFLRNLKPVDKAPVLYFYSKPGQDPTDVVRDLFRQLILLNPDDREVFDAKLLDGPKPSYDDCLAHIERFAGSQSSVIVVIDSLDNCSPVPAGKYTFLRLLRDLAKIKSSCPVKLFISSREPEDRIAATLDGFREFNITKHCISVHSQNLRGDMETFVKSEVNSWHPGEFLPNETDLTRVNMAKRVIIKTVIDKAGCMFLWAVHVLRSGFRDNGGIQCLEDVAHELKEDRLPKTVEEIYEKNYNIIHAKDSSRTSQRAAKAMMVLYCVRKQLSSDSLVDAVMASDSRSNLNRGLDYDKEIRILVSGCRGFIVYDEGRGIIRFQHPSVERYLEGREGYAALSHASTAEVCLRSLFSTISRANSFAKRAEHERGRSLERDTDPYITDDDEKFCSSPYGNWESSDDDDERRIPWDRDLSRQPSRARSISSRLTDRSRSGSRPQSRSGSVHHRSDTRRSLSIASLGGLGQMQFLRSNRAVVDIDAPIQDFQEYATIFWPTHYQLCAAAALPPDFSDPKDLVRDLLVSDFDTAGDPSSRFNQWIKGVRRLLSERVLGFYDEEVEIQLQDCICPPPTPFQVCCVYGFTDLVRQLYEMYNGGHNSEQGLSGIDPGNAPNEESKTGLHLACKFGHQKTVMYLTTISRDPVAFSSPDNTMKTALDYAIESAHDENLISIYPLPEGNSLRGSLLLAAVGNPRCGSKLVTRLMTRRDRTRDRTIDTRGMSLLQKEKLCVVVMTCLFSTRKLVKAVVDRKKITSEVLAEVARSENGQAIRWSERESTWTWLMGRAPEPERYWVVLVTALEVGDTKLAKLIYKSVGWHWRTTEKGINHLFETAASNRRRPLELIEILLEHSILKTHQIRESVLERAIGNPAADMPLILKLRDVMHPDVKLTEGILIAAAKRGRLGVDILILLKLEFGTQNLVKGNVQTTKRVFREVLANSNEALLDLLLTDMNLEIPGPDFWWLVSESLKPPWDRGLDPKVQISHAMSKEYASGLLPASVFKPESPESIVDESMSHSLRLMLDHLPPRWRGSHVHVLAHRMLSVWGPRVLQLLLDAVDSDNENTNQPTVTIRTVVEAAKNTVYGHTLLPFLERRSKTQRYFVEDDVLQAAAEYGDIRTIYFFLGRYPLETYSKAFRIAAAKNSDVSVVEFLYRRLSSDCIGLEELEAAARNSDVAFECLVSHRNESQPVGSSSSRLLGRIIAQYCKHSKTLRKALDLRLAREPESSDNVNELVQTAAQNRHGLEMARFLLKRYQWTDKRVTVSATLLEMAAENQAVAPEMLRLFLNECDGRQLDSVVTVEVLVAAARNGEEAPEAVRMLVLEPRETPLDTEQLARVYRAVDVNSELSVPARRKLRDVIASAQLVTPPATDMDRRKLLDELSSAPGITSATEPEVSDIGPGSEG